MKGFLVKIPKKYQARAKQGCSVSIIKQFTSSFRFFSDTTIVMQSIISNMCGSAVFFSLHSILWYLNSLTTTDATFISDSAAHRNRHGLQLCSCQNHCWVLLYLYLFNCILPNVILNSLKQQGRFTTKQGMKAWPSDIFSMIQCLLLETHHSRRSDSVDVSPEAEFLVWTLLSSHNDAFTHTQSWFTNLQS